MAKKIREMFSLKKVDGEIGIEIEMEGDGLIVDTPSWAQHQDGSLRGSSIEYVLHTPCARDVVHRRLQELEDAWRKYGSRINPSNRCGVHVHYNCQSKTLQEVAIILGIYYIFEDVLLKYCGDDRDGNFFCLGAKHAEVQLSAMSQMMNDEKLTVLQTDQHYRYAAMNITSLAKFGSLELRPLKTTKSMAPVLDWVNIFLCIVDGAKGYKSVKDVVESCSAAGAHHFLCQVFGKYAEQLMCKKYDKMIMEGVRRVQEFAYAPLVLKNKKKVETTKAFVFDEDAAAGAMRVYRDNLAAALLQAENAAPQAGELIRQVQVHGNDDPADWWEAGMGRREGRRVEPAPRIPLPEAMRAELRRLRDEKNRLNALIAAGNNTNADYDAYDNAWLVWHNYRIELAGNNYDLHGE